MSPLQKAKAEAKAQEEALAKLSPRKVPGFGSKPKQEEQGFVKPAAPKAAPKGDSKGSRDAVLKRQMDMEKKALEEKEAMRAERAARKAATKQAETEAMAALQRGAKNASKESNALYDRAMRGMPAAAPKHASPKPESPKPKGAVSQDALYERAMRL